MIYEFSDLTLDLDRHLLTRDGQPVKLTKLSFRVLQALIQAAPALLSHDDLIDQVWGPKRVITPDNLSQRMKTLRQSLGDDPNQPTYIEGVRGEGYRLVPEVRIQSALTSSHSPRQALSSRLLVSLAVLALALGYIAFDKFVLDPVEDGQLAQSARQEGHSAALTESIGDKSIAVLPFVNMSDDAGNEYFSDGLSEELLNLLARIPELKVAARTSSFSFKDKDFEVTEIASRLKVAHVLEGSVRKQGNQLRITAQLIQADNGYHLWSETYNRKLDNVFQIQEDIAIAVVDALKVTLLSEIPEIRKTDPAAYQLFLEGQYLKRRISKDSLDRAVEAFKQAVEIDPAYVPAWAELADTYIWGGRTEGLTRKEAVVLADQAIETAISTDPDYAFAYYVRGISWIFTKYEFKQGIEDFQHALRLDPDDAFIVAAIGKGAFLTGKFDLAISQYQMALAMEPVVPEFYWFLGRTYLSSGRLDDAEASFRKLLSLSPSSYGRHDLWKPLLLKGELEAALAES
ncbi:MAG: tetratricopeptide repeat protein, partial [Xanthomonadales bacterium]|nr:winged helix-turn-helix domain-containing protein [Gammaproteobacteria bacterium]NNK05335.1 tetratricopeptide repeat protein [Xanthomonadales bacterium]